MNSPTRHALPLACALSLVLASEAAVVNDGTSTANLVKLSNSIGGGSAVAALGVNANGALTASQTDVAEDFSLRTVWYASDTAPTTGVYTVSADFQPAADSFENRGGVMGWLSLAFSNGIAFQVTPSDPSSGGTTVFRLSVIDFGAASGTANDSFDHLYNTDGSAASAQTAQLAAGPDYSITNFATFELAFTAPTAADTNAVTNATAHITAKVLQAPVGGGAPVQVGPTIEALTDLPPPDATIHRFGYYAVLGCFSIFCNDSGGGVIGYLDSLTAQGDIGVPPNALPVVNITSPTNGATFTESANITITANATDSDGTVARVDFYAGTTLLGTVTNGANNAFSFTWNNVVAGSYELTAKATDNLGGTTTSTAVNITVTQSTGGGPTLTILRTNNNVQLSWNATGYQLQTRADLSPSTAWTDASTSTVSLTSVTLPIASGTIFFRLSQAGAPSGPRLTVQLSGNSVMISWPQVVGYRLQSKSDLNAASWSDVTTTGNQFSEAISGAAKFYRLVNP